MKKLVNLFASIVCLQLTGCATNPDIGSLNSTQRATLATLQVYNGAPPNNNYKIISAVKGLSCHRDRYKPIQMLSNEEALQGVKMRAAKLGADAVINTFCQHNSGTDWVNNCWASVVCAGDAVKFIGGDK